jgi:hypothetical protein
MKQTTTFKILLGLITAIGLSLSLVNAQDVGDIELIAYWDFENTGDDAWNGHTGTLQGEAKYSDGERFGMALDTSALGAETYFRVDVESAPGFFEAYNGDDGPAGRDQATYVFWQKNLADIKNQSLFWTFSPSTGGGERAMSGHTPWGNNIVYFDTAGCCDGGTQRTNQDSGLDGDQWLEWNHFAFVKNGSTKQIWVNGEILIEKENTDPLPNDVDRFFIGNGREESAEAQPGLVDEFGLIAGAASPEQIKQLAGGASVIDIFDSSDPNFSIGKTVSLGQLPAVSGVQELSFNLRNTGDTKALTLSSIAIVSGDTDNFTLTGTPKTVAAEGSAPVNVTFDSKGEFRLFEVMVEFKTDDPDAEDQTVLVPMRATVLNPVGPVAHYPFDESNTADALTDVTGLGRLGTFETNGGSITLGQPGLQEGSGTSASFVGGAAATVESFPDGLLESFTILLWATPSSLGDFANQDFRTIVAKGQDSPVFGLLEGSGELAWFGVNEDGIADALFLTDGLGLQAGTSYHVAMRYDRTTATGSIWVDGAEVASGAVPAFEDLGAFYAGSFGGALPYEGAIDDLQVYDMVLEPNQVAYLIANPGKSLVPVGDVDSDGDGLSDDTESTTHGTNPLVADTDGDGLSDGEEINNSKTDALLADTDGDGNDDGVELRFGADPLDADSKLGTFLVRTIAADGVEFGSMDALKEALEDPSQVSAENVSNYTFINFRDSGGGANFQDDAPFGLFEGFADHDDFGFYATGTINITEAGLRTFGMNSDDGNQLFIDGTLVAEDPDTHGNRNIFGSIDLTEGEHTVEMYFYERGGGAAAELFVNTELGAVESFDAGNFVLLPAFGDAVADDDGDGLNNFWEDGFFGNNDQDPDDDPDEDGLTNIQELEANTDPTKADTDGDSVNDATELADTTNPNAVDTDGDGLTDGDEKELGTNGTLRDTDGDGFGDGFEAIQGTDPLVAEAAGGDNPFNLRAAWEFNTPANGEIVVDDTTGIAGLLQDGAAVAAEGGQSGEAGDGVLDLNDGTTMKVEDVGFYNEIASNDVVTLVFWQKLTEVTNQTNFKAQSPESSGAERGFSVHAPWGEGTIFFDTAGCCDGGSQRMSKASPDGLDYTDGWHHLGFVKDGATKQIWVDGVLHHEAQNTAPLPIDNTALWVGSAQDGSESIIGLLDDVALFAQALDAAAMADLASGTRPTELGGGISASPSPNLLGYWNVNDAAGDQVTNFVDDSLNGVVSSTTWSGDMEGYSGTTGDYAIDVAGTTDSFVEVPPTGKTFEEITVTGWVKGAQTGAWTGLILSRGAVNVPIGMGIRADSGELAYTWNDNSADTYNFESGLAIPEDQWTFIALTVTPDAGTLYVGSGIVLESAVNEIPHLTQPNQDNAWFFGKDNCCGTERNFDGLIDEVSIWDVALSATEIEALFNGSNNPINVRTAAGDDGANNNGGGGESSAPPIIVLSGPGSIGLTFTGAAGKTYNIEYSEDLVNWAVVQADLSGDIQYEDTDVARLGKDVGYYRGVEK